MGILLMLIGILIYLGTIGFDIYLAITSGNINVLNIINDIMSDIKTMYPLYAFALALIIFGNNKRKQMNINGILFLTGFAPFILNIIIFIYNLFLNGFNDIVTVLQNTFMGNIVVIVTEGIGLLLILIGLIKNLF